MRNVYRQGDRITWAEAHNGPLLTVLDVIDGQYILEHPNGDKFIRPIHSVDEAFRLVRPGP